MTIHDDARTAGEDAFRKVYDDALQRLIGEREDRDGQILDLSAKLGDAQSMITTQRTRITVLEAELGAAEERIAFCEANHGSSEQPGPVLPQITPLSALAVHQGYGVCQHVNFQDSVYQHQAEVLERYGAMHIGSMRSLYVPNLSGFGTALEEARRHGVRWHALVAKMDTTEASVRSRIRHMAANAADVVDAIEGVNEPNGDGFTTADAARAALIQWWIWDEVGQHPELAHVVIYSPSMHDVALENADGRHWAMFANAEVVVGGVVKGFGRNFCHGAAVHGYQGGLPPGRDPKLAQRLAWPREALRKEHVKVTEMGWTNAVNKPRVGGHKVTSERASAAYDVQTVLVYGHIGVPLLRYEFLDDPGAENVTESEFGLFEVESVAGDPDTTWTPKRVVGPLTELLEWLDDPGEVYDTAPVGVDVAAPEGVTIDWAVVQKRDGSTRLFAWNAAPIWDPIAEADLDEQRVDVVITDAAGEQPVTVGAMPVAVDIRR